MARPSPHALPVAEACRRLRELQVTHEVIGLQIKCGAINYWPTTATVRCDGQSREAGEGFDYNTSSQFCAANASRNKFLVLAAAS